MDTAEYRHPECLVSADWLAAHLDDPDLRIFDCTTNLVFEPGADRPYRVESGRAAYERDHIPGSGYLDLQGDFSTQGGPFSFTLPSVDHVARAFERHGVGDGARVVLYSRTTLPWATRFWWMLRWIGFDDAAILDGGYSGWLAGGHAASADPASYAPGKITVRPRPGLFVGKDEVRAAIGADGVCTINALSPDLHAGENPRYGRPGRIPGSVNVPAATLVEPDTMKLRRPAEVSRAFAAVGADRSKKMITYCVGGIFATLDAFLLHQMGHDDIAVYDSSMSEWATDPALPMETG